MSALLKPPKTKTKTKTLQDAPPNERTTAVPAVCPAPHRTAMTFSGKQVEAEARIWVGRQEACLITRRAPKRKASGFRIAEESLETTDLLAGESRQPSVPSSGGTGTVGLRRGGDRRPQEFAAEAPSHPAPPTSASFSSFLCPDSQKSASTAFLKVKAKSYL